MKIKVIWGPPASGKSTYVNENKGDNDLIFDFDLLMRDLSGLEIYERNNNIIDYLVDFRQLIIDKLKVESKLNDAWLIISYPNDDIKNQLDSAEFILMETDKETCKARIDEDDERKDKTLWKNLIDEWFAKYDGEGVDNMAKMIKFKNMEIKNQTDEKAELYIYGDIISGDWKWEDSDVTSTEIRDYLKSIENVKDLNIYVNSGGGSVFSGMAIYNMLKRHKASKTVYVDGIAASIASVIAMAGDKIIIPSNAYLMIHKAWGGSFGNSDDMLEMAATLEKIDEGILNVYKEKLKDGVEIDTIKNLVEKETWMTGDEAANYFNIEVVEENKVAACASDQFKNYKQVPKQLEIDNKTPQNEGDNQVEDINNKLNEDIDDMSLELEILTSSF